MRAIALVLSACSLLAFPAAAQEAQSEGQSMSHTGERIQGCRDRRTA